MNDLRDWEWVIRQLDHGNRSKSSAAYSLKTGLKKIREGIGKIAKECDLDMTDPAVRREVAGALLEAMQERIADEAKRNR